MRQLCIQCGERPSAINYYKNGKVYYRKKCDVCTRNATPRYPRWYQSGYRKKNQCEKCGYTSGLSEQFNVFHIDGNLNNCRPKNLRTICANCQRILHKEGVTWKQGDLVPNVR